MISTPENKNQINQCAKQSTGDRSDLLVLEGDKQRVQEKTLFQCSAGTLPMDLRANMGKINHQAAADKQRK